MRITSIQEKTVSIASEIKNAYIDFSKMTVSVVAIETDVVRDGKPVIGYGFNSNGRYAQGGLLLDSPGLRELQLSDCEDGVATLFEEIETVARDCRFGDCRHLGELGCAVAQAAENGELDPRRLENYLKLRAEQERTEETLVEKRRREKNFGKLCKRAKTQKRSETE